MKEYSFEKLNVWQDGRALVREIYVLTSVFPQTENFTLTSQMGRAAISICSNIAEGSGRTTKADQMHFYRIAYSSLMELLNQLIIATDLDYVKLDKLNMLREMIDQISAQLSALRNSLR